MQALHGRDLNTAVHDLAVTCSELKSTVMRVALTDGYLIRLRANEPPWISTRWVSCSSQMTRLCKTLALNLQTLLSHNDGEDIDAIISPRLARRNCAAAFAGFVFSGMPDVGGARSPGSARLARRSTQRSGLTRACCWVATFRCAWCIARPTTPAAVPRPSGTVSRCAAAGDGGVARRAHHTLIS